LSHDEVIADLEAVRKELAYWQSQESMEYSLDRSVRLDAADDCLQAIWLLLHRLGEIEAETIYGEGNVIRDHPEVPEK
jgi:hypothetical protein